MCQCFFLPNWFDLRKELWMCFPSKCSSVVASKTGQMINLSETWLGLVQKLFLLTHLLVAQVEFNLKPIKTGQSTLIKGNKSTTSKTIFFSFFNQNENHDKFVRWLAAKWSIKPEIHLICSNGFSRNLGCGQNTKNWA